MEDREKKTGWLVVLRRLVLRALLIYVIVVVALAFLQRKLQYFPDSSPVSLTPGQANSGVEDVELVTADNIRLKAWYWPGDRGITLVIFHGNAGHRGHRGTWMERLHALGVGVFMVDYRGYGGSQGSPTEEGLYEDAVASVKWLRERGAGKLVYVGESLGSGVAIELALRRSPAAVIVQSGFSSAVDVARRAYPFLPVGLLMIDRYENLDKVPKVSCPLLVIHGEDDSIVPQSLGRRLFDVAVEPKEWYSVPGADHNDLIWVGGEKYYERLDSFLTQHVAR